jgi:plastocyanin
MKKIKMILLILCFTEFVHGQTTVNVNVANFAFTPSAVNITIGDIVKWTNTGGTHNIDGTTAIFPSNPESFGNSVGAGWIYSHTFTIVGTYNYQCDMHPGSMTGTVTVSPATGINTPQNEKFNIFPNPSNNYTEIQLPDNLISKSENIRLEIYDISGRRIKEFAINSNSTTIDIQELQKGMYIFKISGSKQFTAKNVFIKN